MKQTRTPYPVEVQVWLDPLPHCGRRSAMWGQHGHHGSRPKYPQWPGADVHGIPPQAAGNPLWLSACQRPRPPESLCGRPATSCRFPETRGPASEGTCLDVRPMPPTLGWAPPAAGPKLSRLTGEPAGAPPPGGEIPPRRTSPMPMSTKELQIRAPPANFTEKRVRFKKGYFNTYRKPR